MGVPENVAIRIILILILILILLIILILILIMSGNIMGVLDKCGNTTRDPPTAL